MSHCLLTRDVLAGKVPKGLDTSPNLEVSSPSAGFAGDVSAVTVDSAFCACFGANWLSRYCVCKQQT